MRRKNNNKIARTRIKEEGRAFVLPFLPCFHSPPPIKASPESPKREREREEKREKRRKMGEALGSSYWCHMCSQMVNPVMEVELKCPYCDSGFIEVMEGSGVEVMEGRGDLDAADVGSDRALSLWAPIVLGMMGGSSRRRRSRRVEQEDDEEEDSPDLDHEFVSILRRRRRSSAILQLLQSLQEGTGSESDNPEAERERERERDRDRFILINPFNQAVILQGSLDSNQTQNGRSDNAGIGTSLGDYFVGPGLDLLLQHLADNDPNRYGTPPAKKEAVDAMPAVKVEENMSCSVCLEDFDCGAEAREMPCKHKFHSGCIFPWLELHSSCPVCRFQMPVDEQKDSSSSRAEAGGGDGGDGGSGGSGRRFWVPVPWPFNGLFSLSGSQSNRGSSSAPPSSSSSTFGSDSHGDDN